MKTTVLMATAAVALAAVHPAGAADLAPAFPVKAPVVMPFSWTGCYLGGHLGGIWGSENLTDPVLMVQSSLAGTTVGTTTAHVGSAALVVGGQLGCDYQFTPSWVLGLEGAASGTTLRGASQVPLQNPGDAESITVKSNLITSVTGRLGFAADHWLFYGRGGVAWASNTTSITGSYTGTPFDFEGQDIRVGWTAGAGVEWAFAPDWSARLAYDYYDFGTRNVTMIDGNNAPNGTPLGIHQTAQTVKLGVNFHVWGY